MMEHSQFEGQLASKLHLENEADRDPMMAARIGRFDDADTLKLLKPNPFRSSKKSNWMGNFNLYDWCTVKILWVGNVSMGFWKSQVMQKSQVTSWRRVTWQDFCITRDFQNSILIFIGLLCNSRVSNWELNNFIG